MSSKPASLSDLLNVPASDPNMALNTAQPKAMSDQKLKDLIRDTIQHSQSVHRERHIRTISEQLWMRFPHQGSASDIQSWKDNWVEDYWEQRLLSCLMWSNPDWWDALLPYVDQLSAPKLREIILPTMVDDKYTAPSLLSKMCSHPVLKTMYVDSIHKSVFKFVGNAIDFEGLEDVPVSTEQLLEVWASLPLPPIVTSHIACQIMRQLGRVTDWEIEADEQWTDILNQWVNAWPQHHQDWRANPPACTLEMLHDNMANPSAWQAHWEKLFGIPPLSQRQWALCALVEHDDLVSENNILAITEEDIDGVCKTRHNQQTIVGIQQLIQEWHPTSTDRVPWLQMMAPGLTQPIVELIFDGVLNDDDWSTLAHQAVSMEIDQHPLIVKGRLNRHMPSGKKSSPSKKM